MSPASSWLRIHARHRTGWPLMTHWMGRLNQAHSHSRVSVSHHKTHSGFIVKSTCVTVMRIAYNHARPDVDVVVAFNNQQQAMIMILIINRMGCPNRTLSHASYSSLTETRSTMVQWRWLSAPRKWSTESPVAWRVCSSISRRHDVPSLSSRRSSMTTLESYFSAIK